MFNKDVVALWEPGYVVCNVSTITEKVNHWYSSRVVGLEWYTPSLVDEDCFFENLEDAKKMLTKVKQMRHAEVVYV